MQKSTITIASLSVALVVSNAYWIYKTIDAGVSRAYLIDSKRSCNRVSRRRMHLRSCR